MIGKGRPFFGDAPPPPTHYKPRYEYIIPQASSAIVTGRNVEFDT